MPSGRRHSTAYKYRKLVEDRVARSGHPQDSAPNTTGGQILPPPSHAAPIS